MSNIIDTPEGREWIKSLLMQGPTNVTFTKKDGTVRHMNCTLNEDIAPKYEKKTERDSNVDICFVWDIDKTEWRSFRFDSVTKVTLEN